MKRILFLCFVLVLILRVAPMKQFGKRNVAMNQQPPTSNSCELGIEDFTLPDRTTTSTNQLGFDSGSENSMSQELTTLNQQKALNLTIKSADSFWYTTLASGACFQADSYDAVRFQVLGNAPDEHFRVGVQIGSGPTCQKVDKKFLQWRDGIRNYYGGVLTIDFPLDKFGLTADEVKRLRAVELSGFWPSTIHTSIFLLNLKLVKKNCSLSCPSLTVDDFSNTNPGKNLLGFASGTQGTLTEEFDSVNQRMKLVIESRSSYWTSFLASGNCMDASSYFAVRFQIIGDVPSSDFRVGLQIGSGPTCQKMTTRYLPWEDGVKSYSGNILTIDFSFDQFGLTADEQKRLLAIELSGFGPSTLNMGLTLGELQLVKKECITFPSPCESFVVDDFSQPPNNLLGYPSSSTGYIIANFGPNSLTLIAGNMNSSWFTQLSSYKPCYDLSKWAAIRLSFTKIYPDPKFRVGLVIGEGASCSIKRTISVMFSQGMIRKEAGLIVADFPLDLFGASFSELMSVKAIGLLLFAPNTYQYPSVLTQISLINSYCLKGPCMLKIEDYSIPANSTNLLNFQSGSMGAMGEVLNRTSNLLTLIIMGNNSVWSSGLANGAPCFDASDYSAVQFEVLGNISESNFQVGIEIGSPSNCQKVNTKYLLWSSGIKHFSPSTNILTMEFSFQAFGLTMDEKRNILGVQISGFPNSMLQSKILLSKVQLVKEGCSFG